MAKIDFPGYHLHGKTLPVVREWTHTKWNIPLVTVQADYGLYAISADKVRILAPKAAEGEAQP